MTWSTHISLITCGQMVHMDLTHTLKARSSLHGFIMKGKCKTGDRIKLKCQCYNTLNYFNFEVDDSALAFSQTRGNICATVIWKCFCFVSMNNSTSDVLIPLSLMFSCLLLSPVKDTIVTNDRWCSSGCRCHHGGVYTCKDRYNPGES